MRVWIYVAYVIGSSEKPADSTEPVGDATAPTEGSHETAPAPSAVSRAAPPAASAGPVAATSGPVAATSGPVAAEMSQEALNRLLLNSPMMEQMDSIKQLMMQTLALVSCEVEHVVTVSCAFALFCCRVCG